MPRKLVLIVIDGITPVAFERAVSRGAPALSFLAEHGDYRRATSVFPSLTPVCLTSIATGAGPGIHHIPSLVWRDRRERRIARGGRGAEGWGSRGERGGGRWRRTRGWGARWRSTAGSAGSRG